MAEQTKMPFGMWTRVGPGNHLLDGSLELPRGRAILGDIYKLQGISGVSRSIFGRWQQQCSFSVSVLQELIF